MEMEFASFLYAFLINEYKNSSNRSVCTVANRDGVEGTTDASLMSQ